MEHGIYNSYLEVNLGKIKENIKKIKKGIGENVEIMTVLKGNAYGMGLTQIAKFVVEECGIKTLACAQTFEAASFREVGINTDIFVMGGVPYHNISAIVKLDIMSPAYNKEYLTFLNEEAKKQAKTAKVHIKIETGLNRIGVHPGDETHDLCTFLKSLENIEVVGIYTHFAESEIVDKTFTYEQFAKFKNALSQAKNYGFDFKYVHAFNTAASTWLFDPEITHIRPAGLIFGYDINKEPKNVFKLEEVMSWRSFITSIKYVSAGETVGYNRAFKAKRPTKIAMASFGYGDGYARNLAAFCEPDVIINGKRCKIVATCMDQTFLDITEHNNVKINDTVTIIGRDGNEFISVLELESKMKQTYLSTIATISNRVKRIYI